MSKTTFTILVFCVTISSGCAGLTSSKWAMNDPVYQEKYADSYASDRNKVAQMMKQSSDARFLAGRTGGYGELGILAAEAGGLLFPTAWSEGRVGIKGMLNSGDPTAGLNAGLSVQTPTRLAPFLGVGSYLGFGNIAVNADGRDNDNDGRIDEHDEEENKTVFSIYPEAGLHLWMTSRVRCSLVGQYHFTPEGGVDDFAYGGLQLTFVATPEE